MPSLAKCLKKTKLSPGIKSYLSAQAREVGDVKAVENYLELVNGNLKLLKEPQAGTIKPSGSLPAKSVPPPVSPVASPESQSQQAELLSRQSVQSEEALEQDLSSQPSQRKASLKPKQSEQEVKKPGDRRGVAPIISDAATEIIGLTGGVLGKASRIGKAIPTLVSRNIRRATNRMKLLGDQGKQLAADIEDITFKSERDKNIDGKDIEKIFSGISITSRENVAKLMNGVIELSDIPKGNRDRIERARQDLLEVLDRAMDTFREAGGKRMVGGKAVPVLGGGQAFPQVLNARGRNMLEQVMADKASPKTVEDIEDLIKEGKYKDYADAVQKIRRYHEQVLRGVNGYLERTRTPLPAYWLEWSPNKVLPSLIQRNWLVAHATEKWGFRQGDSDFPFPKADVLISEIERSYRDDAKRLRQFIRAGFGVDFEASLESREAAEGIRTFQFITKIAISPLTIYRNMLDRWAKGMTIAPLSINVRATLKYPPFLNLWIKSAKKVEEDMIRAGAVFSHGSITEGVEPGTIVTAAIGKPFSSSERGNQVYLALVASMRLQQDMSRYLQDKDGKNKLVRLIQAVASLSEESSARVEERLGKAGLLDKTNQELYDILRKSEVAPEELQAMLHRASRDMTFPILLSTKRIWWDNRPWVRVMAQFKTWPIEQMGFIWRSTVKEAAKGNVLPMIRFIAAVALMGELYNILRDWLKGHDESLLSQIRSGKDLDPSDIAIILGKNFLDGGGIGMLADLTWGITDWIVGPTGGTARDISIAVQDAVQQPGLTLEATGKLVRKQAAIVPQVQGALRRIEEMNGETIAPVQKYHEWRGRAWNWKREQEKETIGDYMREPILGLIRGRRSYGRGEYTLAYELTADAITSGDVELAAKYLRVAVKGIEPQDMNDRIRGIRSSKTSKSPLGPVPKKDRTEFLSQFTPEQRHEALRMQAEWLRRYEKALSTVVPTSIGRSKARSKSRSKSRSKVRAK